MYYVIICPVCKTDLDPFKIEDNICNECGGNLSLGIRTVSPIIGAAPNSGKIIIADPPIKIIKKKKTKTKYSPPPTTEIRFKGLLNFLSSIFEEELTLTKTIYILAGGRIDAKEMYLVQYSVALLEFCRNQFGEDLTIVFWAILNIGESVEEIERIKAKINEIPMETIIEQYISIINFFKSSDGRSSLRELGKRTKPQYF